ncbi:uncharacterized protein ATNIH1004_011450 [Aspergillus tanneri]|uniref:Berberine/berberine-like domain-containing protein n=1 Tax=Aspergillus tanneri TaxID=1220188 RepID=A0A5M9M642_9EURO|nr:uncharacterized protein ATNIH1004_011450 [Aspergillus tanneri]KAA8642505.1 hypothetical protein ATNIH1004_011450 [Aspergillus tanneri]
MLLSTHVTAHVSGSWVRALAVDMATLKVCIAIDNMLSLNVVLADRKLHSIAPTDKDLWWALHGTGPNFSIVTSSTLKSAEGFSTKGGYKPAYTAGPAKTVSTTWKAAWGEYINFAHEDEDPSAIYGENVDRLRSIKAQVDSNNTFNQWITV